MKRERMLELSLEVRNILIENIKKEFDVDFYFNFNDLYKVKGGEVRRLKGGFDFGGKFINLSFEEYEIKYNELFEKVKEYIDGLKLVEFKVSFNKLKNYGWNNYIMLKDRNSFDGNWEDFKKYCIKRERTLILKIEWKY